MAFQTPMMPDFSGGPVVFLQEVKSEMSKVVWPTKEEVLKLTVIVIGVSAGIGLYIGGLDLLFTSLTNFLVKR